jgi:hypothetical protein
MDPLENYDVVTYMQVIKDDPEEMAHFLAIYLFRNSPAYGHEDADFADAEFEAREILSVAMKG